MEDKLQETLIRYHQDDPNNGQMFRDVTDQLCIEYSDLYRDGLTMTTFTASSLSLSVMSATEEDDDSICLD